MRILTVILLLKWHGSRRWRSKTSATACWRRFNSRPSHPSPRVRTGGRKKHVKKQEAALVGHHFLVCLTFCCCFFLLFKYKYLFLQYPRARFDAYREFRGRSFLRTLSSHTFHRCHVSPRTIWCQWWVDTARVWCILRHILCFSWEGLGGSSQDGVWKDPELSASHHGSPLGRKASHTKSLAGDESLPPPRSTWVQEVGDPDPGPEPCVPGLRSPIQTHQRCPT